MFSNSENSIPNERFFGIWFGIERFSTPILFDRGFLFDVFGIVFSHIFDREKMGGTKKENEETENSVLFFSIFWVQVQSPEEKEKKENFFFIKKQYLRL